MELNRCTNVHVVCSKYLEVREVPTCTFVARAQCTTRPQIMYQLIALLKLFQCTKFRVASSKLPKSKGAYANAKCTCIARAPCTLSRNNMHHRITIIELHQCTKFGVHSSMFPKTRGPLSNKLFRPWRAQSAPQRNGSHKKHIGWDSRHVTFTSGISGAHRLTCRGGKRTTFAKHLHVHCTCTMLPTPIRHTAPSRPFQGVPTYRVWWR